MSRPAGPPALACTLHDPEGRLLAALTARDPGLARYAAVHVAATEATAPALLAVLRAAGATVSTDDVGRIGAARRRAVQAAAAVGPHSVLYCDFDRWLHWSGRAPDELAALPARIARRRPAPWYVCLGRTARAFATHPPAQRVPEAATNRALSRAVGRRLDATAGAGWLSPEGVALVLAASVEPSNATDLEWPALVHRADPRRLAFLATDGLEFETAEFYRAEIAAAGGEAAWLRATYDRPEVWLARLRLAADSVAALCRVLADPTAPNQ